MIDDHLFPTLPDLMADGALKLQLASRLEPEADHIPDLAGHPFIIRHPCDSGKAHTSSTTHNFQ